MLVCVSMNNLHTHTIQIHIKLTKHIVITTYIRRGTPAQYGGRIGARYENIVAGRGMAARGGGSRCPPGPNKGELIPAAVDVCIHEDTRE